MVGYEPTIIKYEHHLDHAPTEEDKANKVGLEEFIVRLQNAGWIAKDKMATSLKAFDVGFLGVNEEGNHRIVWTATLR